MSGSLPEQFKKAKKKITQLEKQNKNQFEALKRLYDLVRKQASIIGGLNLKILEEKNDTINKDQELSKP